MKLAQSLALATSLLATGAAFSQNTPEGSYPPVPQASSQLSRAAVATEAARFNEAGRPGLVPGEGRPAFTLAGAGSDAASRNEVSTDRNQWVRSGLADLNRGEATPDFAEPGYQAALNRYQQAHQADTARAPGASNRLN